MLTVSSGRVSRAEAGIRPANIRFGDKPENKREKAVKKTAPELKPAKSLFRKAVDKLLWVTPMVNLASGVFLVASSLMPANAIPSKEIRQTEISAGSVAGPQEKAGELPAATVEIKPVPPEEIPSDLKDWLARMGWTLFSISMVTGTYNGIAHAYKAKQPSMMLANLGFLGFAPVLIFDPALSIRAAIGLFGGIWGLGYANTLRNEFNRKPGEPVREMDMAVFVDKKTLIKAANLKEGASAAELTRAWMAQMGKVPTFIAGDVKIASDKTWACFKEVVRHPVENAWGLKNGVRDIYRYASGKTSEKPESLKPSSTQYELASIVGGFVGQVPLIFLGDTQPVVTRACMWIGTLAGLSANASLMTTAIHEKDKVFMVGPPLCILGGLYGETNAGMGVFKIGQAAISNYFRKLIERETSEEAPPESKPDASINKEKGPKPAEKPE